MRNSSLVLVAFAAMLALFVSAPIASAATCNVSHGNCDANVSLTVFTGSPTAVCLIGHPVVLIRVTVTCSGQQAGVFEKKICGIQSDAFTFQALGYEHTLKPDAGYDWEAILNGNCAKLDYKRRPI